MNWAAISGAGSQRGGLDLYPEKVLCVFDADVVGARIPQGLLTAKTALGGRRHELQLDPFAAALFEGGEAFPIFHCSSDLFFLPRSPAHLSQNRRDVGHRTLLALRSSASRLDSPRAVPYAETFLV